MVALVATGLMNKHIADELSINAVTVTMHRSGASRSDYDSMPPYSAIPLPSSNIETRVFCDVVARTAA